ncbi:MAG: NifU family protein [bacterium]
MQEILSLIKVALGLRELYLVDDTRKAGKRLLVFGVRINGSGNLSEDELEKEIRKRAGEQSFWEVESPENTEMLFLQSAYEEVAYLISRKIQPYAKMEGGGIEVHSVDEEKGVVIVDLRGACSGCPSAVFTLAAGIKTTLQKSLPWVKAVMPSEEPREPDFGFYLKKKREVEGKNERKSGGNQ